MFTKSADKNQEKLGDMEGSFGGAINPSEHPVIETAKNTQHKPTMPYAATLTI